MSKERIVVAYSGGLDTSVMVRWLIERKNAEVITFTGDLGHSRELKGVKEKAIHTGAVKAYVSEFSLAGQPRQMFSLDTAVAVASDGAQGWKFATVRRPSGADIVFA